MTTQHSTTRELLDELAGRSLGSFYDLYHDVGPGQSEKMYGNGMAVSLQYHGIRFEREVRYPIFHRGVELGVYRADFVVEGSILLELKCADVIVKDHIRQVLYYLKASKLELGLILNFGPKPTVKRVIL